MAIIVWLNDLRRMHRGGDKIERLVVERDDPILGVLNVEITEPGGTCQDLIAHHNFIDSDTASREQRGDCSTIRSV